MGWRRISDGDGGGYTGPGCQPPPLQHPSGKDARGVVASRTEFHHQASSGKDHVVLPGESDLRLVNHKDVVGRQAGNTPARRPGGVAQVLKSGSGPSGRIPLSPLIHGRARLLILSLLLRTGKSITFTSLRDRLESTDGSLSVHLAKLEEAGLVTLERAFVDKKPQTRIKITTTGRSQFRSYVKELKSIVPGLAE